MKSETQPWLFFLFFVDILSNTTERDRGWVRMLFKLIFSILHLNSRLSLTLKVYKLISSAFKKDLCVSWIGIRHCNVIEGFILSSERPDRFLPPSRVFPFLSQTFWTALIVLKFLFTGLNMRWRLNCFKGNRFNQASVLFRTHCSRLFTLDRDGDVTFCRKHSVTLSNLFTPIHRSSRNNNSLDRPSSSLCNRYRAFSKVSNTRH